MITFGKYGVASGPSRCTMKFSPQLIAVGSSL
jgi:hypothetical protein